MPPVRFRLRLHRGLAALAVLLVLAFESQVAMAATKIITDAEKGNSVQLKLGDILEVHLRSNPTTGYSWYVHPKSTQLLKLLGQSQAQSHQPGVGRPILQVFRFQAVADGNGTLLLHYIRSWERQGSNEEQFEVQVSVR
jgi:predicted secreted protein